MKCSRSRIAVSAALFVTAYLAGCVTTSSSAAIDTHMRHGFTTKLFDVFAVFSSHSLDAAPFLNDLAHFLTAKLDSQGVRMKVHVVDNLELDEKQKERDEQAAFNPAFLLDLALDTISTIDRKPSGGTFRLALYEVGDTSAIWKAIMTTSDVSTTSNSWCDASKHCYSTPVSSAIDVGNAEETADSVVTALGRDGLIPLGKKPK